MINGVLFQRVINGSYCGVEGDNWYLNQLYADSLGKYYEENIERSWYDSNFVDVCSDKEFFNKYLETSRIEDVNFRVLLCETNRQFPKINFGFNKKKLLGFDYAYPGGCYYSSVYNDICSKRISSFKKYQLNSNGLFADLESINTFIRHRNMLETHNEDLELELGDFVIYKLYEAII